MLRSLEIADNFFTDEGMIQLVNALRFNSKLNHLNIQGCNSVSQQSMIALESMVTEINMSLYLVQITYEDYDPDLIDRI